MVVNYPVVGNLAALAQTPQTGGLLPHAGGQAEGVSQPAGPNMGTSSAAPAQVLMHAQAPRGESARTVPIHVVCALRGTNTLIWIERLVQRYIFEALSPNLTVLMCSNFTMI